MRILPVFRGALLCFYLSLLFAATFCYAGDKTVEVVGTGECADCAKSNIKTVHALSGLPVTIDCKPENGEFKTRGFGELDEEGKFKVSLPSDVVKDGKLKEECYAQLHSASAAPCPSHDGLESSKIVLKSKTNEKHTFGLAGKLKFSPVTCTSAFLWPHFKYPPLPKLPPLPKWKLPPLKDFHHPYLFPPKVFPPFPRRSSHISHQRSSHLFHQRSSLQSLFLHHFQSTRSHSHLQFQSTSQSQNHQFSSPLRSPSTSQNHQSSSPLRSLSTSQNHQSSSPLLFQSTNQSQNHQSTSLSHLLFQSTSLSLQSQRSLHFIRSHAPLFLSFPLTPRFPQSTSLNHQSSSPLLFQSTNQSQNHQSTSLSHLLFPSTSLYHLPFQSISLSLQSQRSLHFTRSHAPPLPKLPPYPKYGKWPPLPPYSPIH